MKRIAFVLMVVSLALLLFNACDKGPEIYVPTPYELEIPAGFPEPLIPADNPMTVEKVELGKMLFYDANLSADGTVSCASCHFQQVGFSDTVAFSLGVDGKNGLRNAMPLINVAYAQKLFWDGGVDNLEEQAIHPIINELEMAADPATILNYLNGDSEYYDLFDKAFGAPASVATLVEALASFERTLISGNSPYDHYLGGDSSALSASAIRGMILFDTESAECFHCHTGFNFTDGSFQNNGLYQIGQYQDDGRAAVTGRQVDENKFKVPTLRNIELTAPYMHDGSLATLEEVLDHYASRGEFHPNKSIFMDPINLTEQDKEDLIAFLKSLTDDEFLNNPAFRP